MAGRLRDGSRAKGTQLERAADHGRNHLSDLRGAARLAIDATRGVVDLVRTVQGTIARGGRAPRAGGLDLTFGIAALVYRNIHGVTRLVGAGIDRALSGLAPLVPAPERAPAASEAIVAALNGVLGDHLAATANPLAIPMRLRRQGRPLQLEAEALRRSLPHASGKVLVLVHGSSMNDLQWNRLGHDHGAALERDLGTPALYLHYNSGLHVSINGRAFATLLETLHASWPVPVEEIAIVGHSMGGLVARSAYHAAALARHHWPRSLRRIVFLGTPHHGAPWERWGNYVDVALGLTPWSAPFARLGKIRSAGVTDLRYGNLLDEDWETMDRFEWRPDGRRPVPLPAGVECFAIAGVRSAGARSPGDGIVPLDSALGRHANTRLTLDFPASRQRVVTGIDHVGLLSSAEVYRALAGWLAA
jgi:hypothetical protein